MFHNPNLKRQLPFLIIVFLFITVAFLDRLLPEGMFFDGVIYAAVSRNEAIGKGSFWLPYYGHCSYFWEHPPLMFGIESVFFRIFGDHYFTEKIYCFFIWLVTVFMFPKLWNINSSDAGHKYTIWLPLLMWGITSTVLWAYPNNMLECTMAVFDMLAVLFIYTGIENKKKRFANLFIAGLCIVLASLTKGPVGLFPLAIPAIYWLCFRNQTLKTIITWSLGLFFLVVATYILMLQFPGPRYVLNNYINDQLFNSLAGKREHVDSSLGRLELIVFLLSELLPAIVLAILFLLVGKLLKIKPLSNMNGAALFFLLTGLSASLPIMISIKQRSFYLIPSIPYFVIGLSLFIYPYVSALVNRYILSVSKTKMVNIVLALAAIACIPYLLKNLNTTGRDKELINDIKIISGVIPAKDSIGVCIEMVKDYPFLAYTERYAQLEVNRAKLCNSIVVNRTLCTGHYTDSIAKRGYTKVDLPTMQYDVYMQPIKLRK